MEEATASTEVKVVIESPPVESGGNGPWNVAVVEIKLVVFWWDCVVDPGGTAW